MSLYQTLQKASSEEDVKDTYIRALKLKEVQRNLIDIQTKEIWFEAKMGSKHTALEMFAQIIRYVDEANKRGQTYPPLLGVIDQKKAALLRTRDIEVLLKDKEINKSLSSRYGKSASDVTKELIALVGEHIATHFIEFSIESQEAEFISAVQTAVEHGDFLRINITPANVRQAFDLWVKKVGIELQYDGGGEVAAKDMAVFFFADVMHDGSRTAMRGLTAKLMSEDGRPVFNLNGKMCRLASMDGYKNFWQIYHRPPKEEHRADLLSRRDILLPLDEQAFKGAFYTPLHVVDKAYDLLAETLGETWQKDYILWDMCCGVGNLEVKHTHFRNVYMSTLDQADIDIMNASGTCRGAEIFQYDYLNDDIAADGSIDYSITNKVPKALQKAIKDGKKILVLINPPYAESANAFNMADDNAKNKEEVAQTKVGKLMRANYGFSARELFTQFMARIQMEIPVATLAIFSKMKYVNAPNFEAFRTYWQATFLDGFIVHSRVFEGVTGEFPIGFCVWDQKQKNPIKEITVRVLDKHTKCLGNKYFYEAPSSALLGTWIDRPKVDKTSLDVIPLKNAIAPAVKSKDVRGTKCPVGAIGSMNSAGSDVQHAVLQTALLSSGYSTAGAFFVTAENLAKASVVFTVRRIIKGTWQNKSDQFLQPKELLTAEFNNDCLVWMLFNGNNITASANDLEWDRKKWSIVNHFIPFTEQEVNASGRFESDFMVNYIKDKTFSPEAQAVLDAGKELWREYFTTTDPKAVRDELKLNRPDVGWYQIRNALKKRGTDFSAFEKAYKALSEKLQPQVYTLGFLKP